MEGDDDVTGGRKGSRSGCREEVAQSEGCVPYAAP